MEGAEWPFLWAEDGRAWCLWGSGREGDNLRGEGKGREETLRENIIVEKTKLLFAVEGGGMGGEVNKASGA